MRSFWLRLCSLLLRRRFDCELDNEIRFHLEKLEECFRARGLGPEEARAAARREFGGIEPMKECYRERRGFPWLELPARDVRHACRALRRDPGFTTAALLSLALGIGANSAIFSLYHTFLLRLLPVAHPEELVLLYKTGGWGHGITSYPLYEHLRERTDLFSGVLGRSGAIPSRVRIGAGDQLETVSREMVTGEYFQLLGVQPAMGRLISPDDNRIKGHPVAVISYDLWRTRFAGDPGVLGRPITVEDQPFTVIGVASPAFRGIEVERRVELWTPAVMNPYDITNPRMNWLWLVARIRPGTDRKQLQAAVDTAMAQHVASVYGRNSNARLRQRGMEQRLEVRPGGIGISLLRDRFGRPLQILMAAVGLVLLIACANVANLLLARGAARRRETAVRLSLGASRSLLVRQYLIEAVLLGTGGGLLGLAVAWYAVEGIFTFLPAEEVAGLAPSLDRTVLAFTAAVAMAATLLFGLLPALRATAVDPAPELKAGAGRGAPGRLLLRRALVVAQVALSAVLVATAALFAHSLAGLHSIDLGFSRHDVLAFQLDTPRSWTAAQRDQLRDRLLERIGTLPGVSAWSYGTPGPYLRGFWTGDVHVPGRAPVAKDEASVQFQAAGPRYFETIGGSVLRGREFTASDAAGALKVAIVNQAFVRERLGGGEAVGQVIVHGALMKSEEATIVGVVGDILHQGLTRPPEPTVYLPASQGGPPNLDSVFLLRAGPDPERLLPTLRHELATLSPDASLSRPATLGRGIDDSIFLERMTATLSTCFGALALLLAVVGLYGVLAYAVAQRTGEIGIRMALGAERGRVLWMVLRDGLTLTGTGLLLGVPLAWFAERAGESLLYGVKPGDPLSFLLTLLVLLTAGASAAWIPASRAASVAPLDALRHE